MYDTHEIENYLTKLNKAYLHQAYGTTCIIESIATLLRTDIFIPFYDFMLQGIANLDTIQLSELQKLYFR